MALIARPSSREHRIEKDNEVIIVQLPPTYTSDDIVEVKFPPPVYVMIGRVYNMPDESFIIRWSSSELFPSKILVIKYMDRKSILYHCYMIDSRGGKPYYRSNLESDTQLVDPHFMGYGPRVIYLQGCNAMTILELANKSDPHDHISPVDYFRSGDELKSGPYVGDATPDVLSGILHFVQLHHRRFPYNIPETLDELHVRDKLNIGPGLTMLPSDIGLLTNLVELNISDNSLTILPEEITKLTNLVRLDVSGNRLIELPFSIGRLAKLDALIANFNELTVLPRSIGNLMALGLLNLDDNRLIELPPEIGGFLELRKLRVKSNRLTHLPLEIGDLSQLILLNVSNNNLEELPPEIGNIVHLKDLRLYKNELIKLPPEIGNLTQLKHLSVSYNYLEYLPPEIGNLTQLKYLYLTDNRLIELPPEIGNLSQLKQLNISKNKLITLPSSFAKLPTNVALSLGDNDWEYLPTDLRNCKLIPGWLREKFVSKVGTRTKPARRR